MLERAERIRCEEDLVLPLYEPLAKNADEGDFRAPLLSVLVALAMISEDTMWEKLTFIVFLFDVNDDKVSSFISRRIHQCNLTGSYGCTGWLSRKNRATLTGVLASSFTRCPQYCHRSAPVERSQRLFAVRVLPGLSSL